MNNKTKKVRLITISYNHVIELWSNLIFGSNFEYGLPLKESYLKRCGENVLSDDDSDFEEYSNLLLDAIQINLPKKFRK